MSKKIWLMAIIAITLVACGNKMTAQQSAALPNSLTSKEIKAGWKLLFDGKTTRGWHSYGQPDIGKAWKVTEGTLTLDAGSLKDWQTKEGGDIVYEEDFENFHLKVDWKISKNGNSGIIFLSKEDPAKYQYAWHTGPEMQILDNDGHPDGKIVSHRAGDLYDLIISKPEMAMPVGQWNTAEIIKNKNKLELWLNGVKVVGTSIYTTEWYEMIGKSKFKKQPDFGRMQSGKIVLQDHGNDVWFRNIKIKKL